MQFNRHSTANLPPLAILKNFIVFSIKPNCCFKKPNVESFEKSYSFSRILRQACNNLMKKSRLETRRNIVKAIGKHRVKKCFIWEGDFAFHIINNMAQKNKRKMGTTSHYEN